MKQTSNAQLSTSNTRFSPEATLGVAHSPLDIRRLLWRILDLIVAGLFVFAGLSKIFDLDHLIADLWHFQVGQAFTDIRQLSLASPVEFANDIDNFKILPWPICVALAFYLPWLEIFCGFAIAVRKCYRGALLILTVLMLVFTLAIFAAKVRGLDITCGCFGHASQHWSFPAHLVTNLAILAALIVLFTRSAGRRQSGHQ